MTSQPDMFGGTSKVAEHKLKDGVTVYVRVLSHSTDAVCVAAGPSSKPHWLPKKLCMWDGERGHQDMDVERFKAQEYGWLQ